ncbi:MAG: patatin-like phospholipase family protein [Candidatus Obscuribacterales bacterium]
MLSRAILASSLLALLLSSAAYCDPSTTDGDAALTQKESDARKTQSPAEAVGIKEHDPEAKVELKEEIKEVKKEEKRKSVALALGGGGARGAAHIGVLKALQREGIPIDYIVGNSMGAIIGGFYASGSTPEDLERRALDGSIRKAYLPGGIPPHLLMAPIIKVRKLFTKEYAGLFSGKKFEKYLRDVIPDDQEDLEHTKIRFSAVATNLLDGRSYRLSKGDLPRAMRASASISPLLQPVEIDDKLYVDGGVRTNLPAFSARDTGADIVIAVLVDEPLVEQPKEKFRSVKNTTLRLADIVLAVTDAHQLKFADVVISPNVQGISILSNKKADYQRAIDEGDKATMRAMPAIRKLLGLSSKVAATEKPEL